jgi:hypothetical protein
VNKSLDKKGENTNRTVKEKKAQEKQIRVIWISGKYA